MSNLNGEDLKTTEIICPPCVICGLKSYINHEDIELCKRHYDAVIDQDNPNRYIVEEIKLFRSFFGNKKQYTKLSIEQIIEVRKTIALEALAEQLYFTKDEDGALLIRENKCTY